MKVLSLFSGAGGLDLGFEKAGFEIVAANEIDSICYETFEHNFPKTKLFKKSIIDLKSSEIPKKIDGIIGGPPCQSWSEAGNQLGIKDPRGKLFYEYMRMIKEIKPKFFLAENVSGILHKKHDKAFKNIIKNFGELGYDIIYKMLDASDYDVPQNRKRVFIIGIKKTLKKKFLFPLIDLFKTPKTLKDAISDINFAIAAKPKNKTNEIFFKGNQIPNNEYMTGSFSSIYMSRNRVRSWEEPSFTIQAGGRHAPIHPDAPKMIKIEKDKFIFLKKKLKQYRRLSVRECARIQTFPDSFLFKYNNIADGYKMIGNAVPVRLSMILAKEIKQQILNKL